MNIRLKKISVLLSGLILMMAASCQPKSNERIPENCASLSISSNISPLRAYDTTWEKGDQIGVYATLDNSPLASSAYSNVPFYTKNGDGSFTSNDKILLKKGASMDIVAYYPYSSNVKDFKLPIDVSDQSNPAKIDILYAKSENPATFDNRNVALTFNHKLSQVVVEVVAPQGTEIKEITSTLDGTIVKGSMDLATGKIELGTFNSALSGKERSKNGGTASLSYLLLPGQSLEGKTIGFTINGKRYSHKFTAKEANKDLEGGYRYTFPFTINKSGEVVLLVEGAIIDPMVDDPNVTTIIVKEDGSQEVIEKPGENETPEEKVILEEKNITFNAAGTESQTFTIDAATDETWTAIAGLNQSFVKISQSNTQGTGTLTITLDENTENKERTATVTVTITKPNGTGGTVRKKVITYRITQLAKEKPEAEANLLLLDAPFQNDLNGFEAKSLSGTAVWHHSTHNNVPFAKISGYDSNAKKANANEDWLISPAFDLTNTKVAKLTFSHAINHATNIEEEAKLFFTTNYSGDVKSAQWQEVKIVNYPTGKDWTFVPSGEILFPAEVLGKSNVRFAFKYTSTDSSASTWEINNLQVKVDAGKMVEVTTPTPDPEPEDPKDPTGKRTHYMEIPYVMDGSMTNAYYYMHTASDSWFAGGSTPGGKRRNYTVYMSKKHRLPYWIAYPLYPDCFGSQKRTNAWGWDPDIPNEYQPNLSSAYDGSPKQSRGHMLASGARTASRSLNKTTFYYSNMIPQIQGHNGGNWASFENVEQGWGRRNDNDTIYVVTGPIFDPNGPTCTDNSGNRIPIPTHSWKVLLRYDRVAKKYYSIAVKIPNIEGGNSWDKYMLTVAALEKELGVTFFTHLPADVAKDVKSQLDKNRW